MPLYVYRCPVCEIEVETRQKVDDPDPYCQDCWTDTKPGCDENPVKMERLISQTTFILKGSGWGKDGYK
jgi:putative FmdB family regulatory protein